ncbi:MAG: hypothetical protein IAF94_08625 [Pirellulaceae bacterium]|nr:hypothetical protein [Pirellulaceae bacterium]
MTTALTVPERRARQEAEKEIRAGLTGAFQSFWKIGAGLKKIREGRLYRADFATFEAYCQDVWGFSRQRAYQLIQALSLSTKVDKETHARALLKAPPEDAPAIVAIAKAQGPITAPKLQTAHALLEDATKGLTGRAKAEKVAEVLRKAEAEAPRDQPQKPSLSSAVVGLLVGAEKKLLQAKAKWQGMKLAARLDQECGDVLARLGRLIKVAGSG